MRLALPPTCAVDVIEVDVRTGGAFDAANAVEFEDFANFVDEVVELELEVALREEFFRRRGARAFGELFRDVGDQGLEFDGVGDRRGFAKEFDHRGDAVGAADGDAARFGFAVGTFFHRFLTGFADQFDGEFFVAFGFFEGFFAFHHRQTGLIAERFNHSGGNSGHFKLLKSIYLFYLFYLLNRRRRLKNGAALPISRGDVVFFFTVVRR